MQEENWRKLVNDLPDLPEDGAKPPDMEKIKQPSIKDGESPVVLQKIITEVYVYTSLNSDDLYFASQAYQDVQILGNMRLSEAEKIINSAKKKRRRK